MQRRNSRLRLKSSKYASLFVVVFVLCFHFYFGGGEVKNENQKPSEFSELSSQTLSPPIRSKGARTSSSLPKEFAVTLKTVHETSSSFSRQTQMVQEVNGIPIYPGGTLTLDQDHFGRTLATHGKRLEKVSIINERLIIKREAEKLLQAQAQTKAPLDPQPLLWMRERGKPLFQAWASHIDGIEYVIDAQTGELLEKTDRRVE